MTDASRLYAGLAISLFLHFMLFHLPWSEITALYGQGQRLSHEFTSGAPLIAETVSVSLEAADAESARRDGVDKRAQERRRYLEDVLQAVHARRFVSPLARREFIGLALFSLTIVPDGTFQHIRLSGGSGNPALDRAAEEAVRQASGVVKRPSILGTEEISLVLPVKYQYAL